MPTVTINLPNTTFVSSAQPDDNLSYNPVLYTGTDSIFQNCISFLEVAIPSFPVNAIESAFLELTVISNSGTEPSPVVINRVTETLNTSIVTYNTSPAFTVTPAQVNITTSDLYNRVQIDITALVNEWLNGTYTNNGLALTNSDGTTIVQFATNNIVYEPYYPTLTLTYSGSPIENSALCFSYAQLAHIIEQLITMYPTNVITVFTKGVNASSITGTPYSLYSSPEGTYGSNFILMDNGQEQAIPLNSIAAINTGNGTVYNPSITYLEPLEFTEGCDTNLVTACYNYLPVKTEVQMYLGTIVLASGSIYKNEYGILVVSDVDGNTPIFVPVFNITAVIPVVTTMRESMQSQVMIKSDKDQ